MLGSGICGLDLGKQDVADVVPVRDQGQRGVRVLVGGVEVRRGAIQAGPGEAHQQLWLAPRGVERSAGGTFELARRFQTLLVVFDGLVLASSTLRRDIPEDRPKNPNETGIIGGGGPEFFNNRAGLGDQLLHAVGMATSQVGEIAEAGNGADFGVDEGGVGGGGLLELGDGLGEVVFDVLRVGGFIEAVDGAAPASFSSVTKGWRSA